jgi:hypothetical protein
MVDVAVGPVFVKVCRPCAQGAVGVARLLFRLFR